MNDWTKIACERSLRGIVAFYAIFQNEVMPEETLAVLRDPKLLAALIGWANAKGIDDVCLAAHQNPARAGGAL